ncbi:MAG: tetratricopeptide repeat protein, partial [Deltaproteobacteria bacterium]|nr:tetratricopeptide repeat protein [Deltaproteobacteria bacterium]
MGAWPPVPFAAAVELLNLEAKGSSTWLRVGSRLVALRKGRMAWVGAKPGVDVHLDTFLVAAGRLEPSKVEALAQAGLSGELLERRVLAGDEGVALRLDLRPETLREALRAVWIERLLAGFTELGPHAALEVVGEEALPEEGGDLATLPLVLDALCRWASIHEAEAIGTRWKHWVRFAIGPQAERARKWAEMPGSLEVPVRQLLQRHPSAASRIAALALAGFAILLPEAEEGPPPPSRPSIRPSDFPLPSREGQPVTSQAQPVEASDSSSPSLHGGTSGTPELISKLLEELGTEEPWSLPESMGSEGIHDPIGQAEARALALEAQGASPPERAWAWREVARIARELGLFDESARAAREAAYADPSEPDHLRAAAEACLAIEEVELAVAYIQAATRVAQSEATLYQMHFAAALLFRALGRFEEALDHAERAAQVQPARSETWALAAEIALEANRPHHAAQLLLDGAIRLQEDPRLFLFWLSRAHRVDPEHFGVRHQLAVAFEHLNRHDMNVALLSDSALRFPPSPQRYQALLEAAERAEQLGLPVESATLVLGALDAEPELDVLWDVVDHYLLEAGALVERAVVLEEIALAAASLFPNPSEWWLRAAQARSAIEEASDLEVEYRIRAWVAAPESDEHLHAIEAIALKRNEKDILWSAFERVIRSDRAYPELKKKRALEMLLYLDDSAPLALREWVCEVARSGHLPGVTALSPAVLSSESLMEQLRSPVHRSIALERSRRFLKSQPLDEALIRILMAAGRAQGHAAIMADAYHVLAE